MELDDLVCYCFRVPKRKIVHFIRQRRPKRASQVSECFGAGTGCGWCIPFLIRLHREGMGDAVVEGVDISTEEYERLRLEYQRDVREGRARRNRYAPEGGDPLGGDADADDPDAGFTEDPDEARGI
jgi:NAD(P)H-nitrite reductase large subunit